MSLGTEHGPSGKPTGQPRSLEELKRERVETSAIHTHVWLGFSLSVQNGCVLKGKPWGSNLQVCFLLVSLKTKNHKNGREKPRSTGGAFRRAFEKPAAPALGSRPGRRSSDNTSVTSSAELPRAKAWAQTP